MSDEEMARLPQRSMTGVGTATAVRTVVSGLAVDLGRLRSRGRGGAPPDVGQAREEARRAGMSEEDRAWEDASLRRERERRGAIAGTPRRRASEPGHGGCSRWRRWWQRLKEGP